MSTMTQKTMPDTAAQDREALLERLLQATSNTYMLFGVHLGGRLGLYEALAGGGPMTSAELAARTGTHERYVREWLEHQTVTGLLRVENPDDPPPQRRFSLPEGHREVVADCESLNYIAPLAQLTAGVLKPLESVVEAFRKGAGVPYAAYGQDLIEGQAAMNRAAFLYQLGQVWLPSMPDVHARLQADPPARIADVGCGAGWSSIGMARCYPKAQVDGFDLDEPSIEMARANARAHGIADRIRFEARDAGDSELAGQYDLVTAFECVHDMSDPVAALAAMRRLAGEDGAVLVMDERVGESFTPAGNDVEPLMYGFSVFHCLPVGMAEQPSAGTGTVMRPDTLRRYAREAGFRDIETLPIDNFFFRFYRLRQ